jgi:hypothetical protein
MGHFLSERKSIYAFLLNSFFVVLVLIELVPVVCSPSFAKDMLGDGYGGRHHQGKEGAS